MILLKKPDEFVDWVALGSMLGTTITVMASSILWAFGILNIGEHVAIIAVTISLYIIVMLVCIGFLFYQMEKIAKELREINDRI